MSHHPPKADTVAVLLEVARRAAENSNCQHPEDIATVMTNAVEHAAVTIDVMHKRSQ